MKLKSKLLIFLTVIAISVSLFSGCDLSFLEGLTGGGNTNGSPIMLDDIPEFDGKTPYVEINGGVPFFDGTEVTNKSYETYSELDSLGRCGVAISCIGIDLMPTEDRGSIGQVKPSGWQTVKYDIVDGKYLYNRCHLIGFQLTGENANEKNLITGTRYMNVDGMLPFENMVADYVKETELRVLYRVTPIYSGSNLVANGVLMEALSVADGGDAIEFCVYVYNNQPGININYMTGESALSGDPLPDSGKDDSDVNTGNDGNENDNDQNTENTEKSTYVLNKSSKKYHKEDCSGAASIKEENKEIYEGSANELDGMGYSPCGICKPD